MGYVFMNLTSTMDFENGKENCDWTGDLNPRPPEYRTSALPSDLSNPLDGGCPKLSTFLCRMGAPAGSICSLECTEKTKKHLFFPWVTLCSLALSPKLTCPLFILDSWVQVQAHSKTSLPFFTSTFRLTNSRANCQGCLHSASVISLIWRPH